MDKLLEGKLAMLAQPTQKMKDVDYRQPVYVQPKLDGVRCLFTKNGAFTRRGNKFMNVTHLEAQLFEFFNDNPDVILDGELYNHDLKNDFEKIISLVKKTVNITPDDRTEASGLVQYHLYDVVMDTTYRNRIEVMDNLLRKYKPYSVHPVPTLAVQKEEEVYNLHEHFKSEGYEGSMIRIDAFPYESKRSKSLIKVKDFIDFEAEVIGYVEGKGKLKGKLGKFLMKRLDTGKEFGAPASGHTHEQRKELWENRETYLGTEWTVEAFEFTKTGAPRFPVLKTQRNYE